MFFFFRLCELDFCECGCLCENTIMEVIRQPVARINVVVLIEISL